MTHLKSPPSKCSDIIVEVLYWKQSEFNDRALVYLPKGRWFDSEPQFCIIHIFKTLVRGNYQNPYIVSNFVVMNPKMLLSPLKL